ncbi:MAG: GntR family transcriptional regulator [Novosphingobium sp.]
MQATADRLREMIYATEPESRIGSLTSLAEALGVGIVTVQQAARVLEHEGLLDVRRGPGGGYYGKRPDEAALERSLAAYMRTQPSSWEEALEMTSLLFNELAAAAAQCRDDELHEELEQFLPKVDACASDADMGQTETEFQDLLFRMVNRPLFELLTRVTLRFAESRPNDTGDRGLVRLDSWKAGRHRIIGAILDRDEELARFEADRSNRRPLLARVRELAR